MNSVNLLVNNPFEENRGKEYFGNALTNSSFTERIILVHRSGKQSEFARV